MEDFDRDQKKMRPLHTGWYLLCFAVVALTVWVSVVQYPLLPEEIPLHFDIYGNPDRYGPKSVATLAAMPTLQLVLTLLFAGQARQSAKAPEAHRTGGLPLFLMGILTVTLLGLVQLTMLTLVEATRILWFTLVYLAVVVGLSIHMARRVGRGREPLSREEAAHWRYGFYSNKENPAVFVPKRYGLGYTINFGNPWGCLAMAGLLLPLLWLLLPLGGR